MPSIPGGDPMILGLTTVTASGTPVSILKNFPIVDTESERIIAGFSGKVSSILFKSPNASSTLVNTGIVYIGSANMNIATGEGVIIDIGIGESFLLGSNDSLNLYSLGDLYMDADNADDGLYISAVRL